MKKLLSLTLTLVMILTSLGVLTQTVSAATVELYAAPTALGTGDGSSAVNAAAYTNGAFWSTVKTNLASNPVTVYFTNGTYSSLTLSHISDPINRLCVRALNTHQATFSSSASTLINILGSQNLKIEGFNFTGAASSWAISCVTDGRNPVRNVLIQYCDFTNLTSSLYGGIGIQEGAREVTVDSCTFTNVGSGTSAHAIYVSHEVTGTIVSNSSFTDIPADYVRFRADSDYSKVTGCTFRSTKSSTCFAFIRVPMFNDVNPGTDPNTYADCDYFGDHLQVSGNSFTYDVASGTRAALQFSCDGYQPRGLHTALTSSEANTLNTGTTGTKRSFLMSNMDLEATQIKFFSNTFNSRVTYRVAYTYNPNYGYSGNGWSGSCNISDVPDTSGATLSACPSILNGDFAIPGYHMRQWNTDGTILWHPGFDGTVAAARLGSTTTNQSFWQWLPKKGTSWELNYYFMIGAFTGTGPKFRVDIMSDEVDGNAFSMGVNDLGQFGSYNGGTFVPYPSLGTVEFSQDNNGNGYYNDTGDKMRWYHVRVKCNDSADPPFAQISVSDANNATLLRSVNITTWVGTPPVHGVTYPSSVTFKNYNAKVAVDGVSFLN